ncbi:MAG TPA: hypothetical protein VGQ06_15085 [Gemmatimonadales bacterium]|jgi:hypothetical protein|nr:hypothetical protein [Gemmatimonadales bacterium]
MTAVGAVGAVRAVRAVTAVVLAAAPARLNAQHVVVGPQVVFGDYREVSADLHFRGGGGGVAGAFTWKKLGVEASFASIKYEPSGGTATQSFKAKQFDLRVRYYVAGPVSAELGVVNRKAEPEFEAQSAGAVRGGVRMSYLLGPGVHMSVRGGMLFGAKFSGGGASSPVGALELGLSMTVDAVRGRGRLLVDYDFQRIARTTGSGSGEVDVPIQQSLGRVGIALAF